MQEFASVSASSYDPAAMVARLNEKSADGWSVVSIVSTGGDITAFLSREASTAPASSVSTASTVVATATSSTAAVPATASVDEPAGWAASPAVSVQSVVAAAEPAVASTTGQPTVAVQAAAQVAASTVPAQWAADPTGRYELRYWDGTRWTEHVSRAGQQYTDAL